MDRAQSTTQTHAGGRRCSDPLLLSQPTEVQHCQANALRTCNALHSPGISSPHCFRGGTVSPLARLPTPVILYLTASWWLLQILGEIMVLQLSIQSLAQRVHIPQKADSLVRQRSGKQKRYHPQRDNNILAPEFTWGSHRKPAAEPRADPDSLKT